MGLSRWYRSQPTSLQLSMPCCVRILDFPNESCCLEQGHSILLPRLLETGQIWFPWLSDVDQLHHACDCCHILFHLLHLVHLWRRQNVHEWLGMQRSSTEQSRLDHYVHLNLSHSGDILPSLLYGGKVADRQTGLPPPFHRVFQLIRCLMATRIPSHPRLSFCSVRDFDSVRGLPLGPLPPWIQRLLLVESEHSGTWSVIHYWPCLFLNLPH